MAYKLKNFPVLHAEGVNYRCILWGISRNKAVNRLKSSVLENEDVL